MKYIFLEPGQRFSISRSPRQVVIVLRYWSDMSSASTETTGDEKEDKEKREKRRVTPYKCTSRYPLSLGITWRNFPFIQNIGNNCKKLFHFILNSGNILKRFSHFILKSRKNLGNNPTLFSSLGISWGKGKFPLRSKNNLEKCSCFILKFGNNLWKVPTFFSILGIAWMKL